MHHLDAYIFRHEPMMRLHHAGGAITIITTALHILFSVKLSPLVYKRRLQLFLFVSVSASFALVRSRDGRTSATIATSRAHGYSSSTWSPFWQ